MFNITQYKATVTAQYTSNRPENHDRIRIHRPHKRPFQHQRPDNGFEGIGDDCRRAASSAAANRSSSLRTCSPKGCISCAPPPPHGSWGASPLAVNLSDVASMGARPIATLLSLSLPDDATGAWAEEFMRRLPGAVPRIRRNARRGRHHPFGGRHHDQRHRHRPRRRHAYQTPQRSASRRRDFHGGSARSLRGGPARHSRGPSTTPPPLPYTAIPGRRSPKASGSAGGTKYMP